MTIEEMESEIKWGSRISDSSKPKYPLEDIKKTLEQLNLGK